MTFTETQARRVFDEVVREPGPTACKIAAYVIRHSPSHQELAALLAMEARRAKTGVVPLAAELLRQGAPDAVIALQADPLPQIKVRAIEAQALASLKPTGDESLTAVERTLLQLMLGVPSSPLPVPQVIELVLDSADPIARRHAARALATREEAAHALIAEVDRRRPPPSEELLTILGAVGDPAAIPYLRSVVDSPSLRWDLQPLSAIANIPGRAALSTLFEFLIGSGSRRSQKVGELLRSRRDHDVEFYLEIYRHNVALFADHSGLLASVTGSAAIPLLVERLLDPRRAVRAGAADGLRQLRAEAVPAILPLLASDSEDLQIVVLALLANARDDRTAPAVIRLLDSDRARVREAAARSLAVFSAGVVREAAIDLMSFGSERLRQALVEGIGHESNHGLASVLVDAMADRESGVSAAACQAAERLLSYAPEREQTRRDMMAHSSTPSVRMKLDDIVRRLQVEEERRASLGKARASRYVSPDEPVQPPAAQPRPSEPISEAVWFAVTAPPAVEPSTSLIVDVWAHGKGDHREVRSRARAAAAGRQLLHRAAGPARIATGGEMSVTVTVPGFTPERTTETLWWTGEIATCSFALAVPREASAGPHVGRAEVHVSGLRVVTLLFQIDVAAVLNPIPIDVTSHVTRLRTAFASYATEDRQTVLGRIQGMLSVMPDLDVFLDVMSLRSGERWMECLRKEIESRDAFYLFWSLAASRSEWVQREWRLALQSRGLDHINPVPLVSPEVVPPPSELASLHFNSWTLSVSQRSS
jgi:HEAT repeat protein